MIADDERLSEIVKVRLFKDDEILIEKYCRMFPEYWKDSSSFIRAAIHRQFRYAREQQVSRQIKRNLLRKKVPV